MPSEQVLSYISLVDQDVFLLKADKTVVMIAHTLPIIRNADKILVLDQGRIIESGTHDQLVKNGGKYAAMWAASQALQ